MPSKGVISKKVEISFGKIHKSNISSFSYRYYYFKYSCTYICELLWSSDTILTKIKKKKIEISLELNPYFFNFKKKEKILLFYCQKILVYFLSKIPAKSCDGNLISNLSSRDSSTLQTRVVSIIINIYKAIL